MKRLFDLIISILCILLLFPIIGFVILWIKRGDKGPVFYKGIRIGHHGRPFKMLKFRTMVINAEKIGGPSTSGDDPRITKAGHFLRRYKLDELPQFFNVFLGEMSIVGPRPEVKQYVDMYSDEEREILRVRPGITDWASLWNSDEGAILAGSVDPEKTYIEKIRPTKIKLQLEYAKKHSLLIDLQIIFLTILTILTRKRHLPFCIQRMIPEAI